MSEDPKFYTGAGYEAYMGGEDCDDIPRFSGFRKIFWPQDNKTMPPADPDKCLRCPEKIAQKYPHLCEKCTSLHKEFIKDFYPQLRKQILP